MKKLMRSTLCLAILLSNLYHTRACSSYLGPEGFRIGLFLPYTYYKPWLGMLQFDFNSSQDPDISLAIQHDRDINIMQWQNYCGKKIKKQDIYFVMYEMPPGYFLDIIAKPIEKVKTEGSNTFIRWLTSKENKAVLDYMKFAKYCESVSVNRIDPWDEDMLDFDKQFSGYYNDGYEQMVNCKDQFLKQRWAFQFTRMHAYGAGDSEKIKEAQRIAGETNKNSMLDGWTYAYMTFNDDLSQAEKNILLAKAFNLSNDKKYFAMKYFSSPNLAATIREAGNDRHLRATVYGLAVLNKQDESLDLIQKMITDDINNEILEIAIAREIQKVENVLVTTPVTGFYPVNSKWQYNNNSIYFEKEKYNYGEYYQNILKDINTSEKKQNYYRQYAQNLLQAIENMLASGQLKNKAFYHLAAAQMGWCLKDEAITKRHLDQAAKKIKRTDELFIQLEVQQVLLATLKKGELSAGTEKLALSVLQHIGKNKGFDAINLHEQLCMALCAHYEENDQLYRSTLLMSKVKTLYKALPVTGWGYPGDFTNSFTRYFANKAGLQDADYMTEFLAKKTYTGFEQYIMQSFSRDSVAYDQLMEWVGSVYVRNEQWEKAKNSFAQVDKKYWNLSFDEKEYSVPYKNNTIDRWSHYPRFLDANPFSAEISGNHSPSKADSVHYNKYTFVTKFIQLQYFAKSKNKETRDRALLQMANARYNMTWYGNSWIMWRNEWSSTDGFYWPGFENSYYACEGARRAYDHLYHLSTNPNVKARCLIMLAVCERNKALYDHRSDEKYKYKGSEYMKILREKYNNTDTYHQLMSACPGAEDFLAAM